MATVRKLKALTASGNATECITGAKKVTLICKRSADAGGTSTFSATVWCKDAEGNESGEITYNRWISNVANSNAETITRVASLAIAASNASAFLSMSPEDTFDYIKVAVAETADGTHDAWLVIDF